jgi:Tol biopolymer transport system component
MGLSAGTRLGPYEIVAPLGAGGMGEVYRARDTRLGRDVAVKVIRPRLSTDSDQLRRFEQEARAASQLNHPNILVVHDLGSHEGSPYIVSELLDGESLRDKLGAPLPPKRTVEYAVQVAHGLAAAHEKGIVHRDLKPENLFVTRDGRIKILDFGVAKLVQPALPSVSLTEAPTAAPGTDAGVVLGTVGYMSPEQVLGKQLDSRGDLFSLGVVLYEMLSGNRPFRKDTAPETMAAILREEPPELTATNKAISPGLDRIVRHCLEKEPTNRFQTARDIAFALESLSQASTAGAAPLRVKAGRRPLAAVALAIALLAVCGAGSFLLGKRAGEKPAPTFQRLTFRRGYVNAARFAPDGQTVVYSADWEGGQSEVFSLRLGSPESRSLGYHSAELLAISTTGELALSLNSSPDRYPWTGAGTLARVAFAGGTPRPLEEGIAFADWSRDGKDVAVVRETSTDVRLENPPGHLLYSTGGYISSPRISPIGDLVAFIDHPSLLSTEGSVAVVDKVGKKTTLTDLGEKSGLAWSPRGEEIWFNKETELRAVTIRGRQRLLFRQSVPIRLLDVARNGRVLVTNELSWARSFFRGEAYSVDRELSLFDWSLLGGLSRDGRRVLLNEQNGVDAAEGGAVYLRETSGGPPMKVGTGMGWLSPDERFVVASSTSGKPPGITIYPVGAGQPKIIPLAGFDVGMASLLPDGHSIVFYGKEATQGGRIWLTNLEGSTPRPITPEGGRLPAWRPIPPDGRYVLGGPLLGKLLLYPVAGGEPLPVVGLLDGEDIAGWCADGRSFFAYRRFQIPWKVYRVNRETGTREFAREVIPMERAGRPLQFYMFLTPDGRNCAYTQILLFSELYAIDGVK